MVNQARIAVGQDIKTAGGRLLEARRNLQAVTNTVAEAYAQSQHTNEPFPTDRELFTHVAFGTDPRGEHAWRNFSLLDALRVSRAGTIKAVALLHRGSVVQVARPLPRPKSEEPNTLDLNYQITPLYRPKDPQDQIHPYSHRRTAFFLPIEAGWTINASGEGVPMSEDSVAQGLGVLSVECCTRLGETLVPETSHAEFGVSAGGIQPSISKDERVLALDSDSLLNAISGKHSLLSTSHVEGVRTALQFLDRAHAH